MTIYTLPEPFPSETRQPGTQSRECQVVAYDGADRMFLVVTGGVGVWLYSDWLDPPPPIPAAARKPEIGEVWMVRTSEGTLAPRMVRVVTNGIIYALKRNGDAASWSGEKYVRPATPEEAEPFRRIMDGLKRSLGEA